MKTVRRKGPGLPTVVGERRLRPELCQDSGRYTWI